MNVQVVKQRLLSPALNCAVVASRSVFDRRTRKFFELKTEEEPDHFSSTQPNQFADIEKNIAESKAKLKWRSPVVEKDTLLTTGLRFFAPERTKYFFSLIQRPMDFDSVKEALTIKSMELSAADQRFIPDRHRILGNDLAAAHFLVARGGQVRFTRSKEWCKKNELDEYDLPSRYNPDYLVDAIKCDNMELYYEGLENIRRLQCLRYISFRNVKTFDDWCMDRICGNQFERIEILDVSGTTVSANGLIAVPKLRQLKALVIDTNDRSVAFQLACSLLEEVMPHLRILNSADVHDDDGTAAKEPVNTEGSEDKKS